MLMDQENEETGGQPDPGPESGLAPERASEPEVDRGDGDGQSRLGTGEPRVDAALSRLDVLPDLPVSEHPAVLEQVHASLREVLGELDQDVGPPEGAERRQDG